MKRMILTSLALLAATCAASRPGRADGPGSSAAPFLRASVGARFAGLGGAGSTLAEDATSLHYNPAGLAEARGLSMTSEYVSGLAGTDRQFLGAVLPVGEAGGIGVSLLRWDYGSTDRTLADATGAFAGNAGTFSGSDLALRIGYGTRIGSLRVGAAAGFVRQKVDDVSGDGAFLTLGARWEDRTGRLRLAAALRNLGTRLDFTTSGERPAAEGVLGVSYRALPTLTAALDLSYAEDGGENAHAGVEWRPRDWVALRGGYTSTTDAGDGFTGGVGVVYEGIALDYAFAPFGDLGDDHRVSLSYAFGGRGGAVSAITPKPIRGERK